MTASKRASPPAPTDRRAVLHALSGLVLAKAGSAPGPVQAAYGSGIAEVFLWATSSAAIALLAIAFLREIPLRTTVGTDRTPTPGA
ncbi:hypothetical protein ACQP1W_22680 [Spirillospora sp. CA-255316]